MQHKSTQVIYIFAYVHAIHVDLDGKDELSSIHSAFGVEGDEPVLLPDKITLLEIFDNKLSRAFYDIPKRMYQHDFECKNKTNHVLCHFPDYM
jgi:hypothetical protein